MNIRTVGDYEIGERVMTDDLSVTYLARHMLTGASVALREFRRDVPDSNDALQQELASLVDTFHPFISCLYEVIDLGDAAYLAVEWPDLGNLRDVVQDRGPLSESQARPILMQLISALEDLQYAQDLTFRDLRAENVRLDAKMNIKLGHFVRGDSVPAPELLMEQGPTAAIVIWSLGVLLFEIVSGRSPFEDPHCGKRRCKILHQDPTFPVTITPTLKDLLHCMLAKDPNERITLENIKQHPWTTSERVSAGVRMDFKSIDRMRIRRHPLLAPLDPALLEQMSRLGVDVSNLAECFAVRKGTAATATYRILLREKMREDAAEVVPCLARKVVSRREATTTGPYLLWMKSRSGNSWDGASLQKKYGKVTAQRPWLFRPNGAGDTPLAGACVYAY
jgi:serine/threonine protein kinase